jgi:hypothetical protein
MADGTNEISFEFTGNGDRLIQSLQSAQSITKVMRDDILAYDSAMDSVIDKAEKLRSFLSDNVDLVNQMKSVLEIISTIQQGNQASLNNSLTFIKETAASIQSLGGNANHLMSALQAAGMNTGGASYNPNVGNQISAGNTLASQDFSYRGTPGMTWGGGTSNEDLTEDVRRGVRRRGGGGGGRGGGPGGPGGYDFPPNDPRFNEPDDDDFPARSGLDSVNVDETTQQNKWRKYLEDNYPNIAKRIGTGYEYRSPEIASELMMDRVRRTFGNGTISKTIGSLMRGYGYDRYNLKQARYSSGEMLDIDPITGQHMTVPNLPSSGDVRDKSLQIADKFFSVMDKGLNGFVGKAVTSFTKASVILNAAQIGMNAIRGYTGYAQQMGGLYGTVSYGRTISDSLHDWWKAGMGFNPFYSAADVAAARQSLLQYGGFKGTALNNAIDTAMTMRTNYGLNAPEAAQMITTAQTYGINNQQLLSAYNISAGIQARNTMPPQYAQMAFQEGISTIGGLGGNASATAAAGVANTYFGSVGGLALQTSGATLSSFAGSMIGQALMAQQMGVSFTQLPEAMQKMSGGRIAGLESGALVNLLSNIFDVKSIKKENDLWPYAVQILMVLQKLGIPNINDYKEAVAYAWSAIQTSKNAKALSNAQTLKDFKSKLDKKYGGAVTGLRGSEAAVQAIENQQMQLFINKHHIGSQGVTLSNVESVHGYSISRPAAAPVRQASTLDYVSSRLGGNLSTIGALTSWGNSSLNSRSTGGTHHMEVPGGGITHIELSISKPQQSMVNAVIKSMGQSYINGTIHPSKQALRS